jgi:hypothetical protein
MCEEPARSQLPKNSGCASALEQTRHVSPHDECRIAKNDDAESPFIVGAPVRVVPVSESLPEWLIQREALMKGRDASNRAFLRAADDG